MKKVTAAIMERRGRVLIARRKSGGRAGGKWEFPGGTVEPGETPQECLARELAEELGVVSRIGDALASGRADSGGHRIELAVFRVEEFKGPIRLRDHDLVRWVRPRELPLFDLAQADAALLPEILARLSAGRPAGRK